ncbi:MAG: hypothetical protein EBT93_07125, partial [Alphaproteobacteria bacterium]|nr:hypothetical protein [Alphaproteobacteria bacterium]
MLERDTKSIMEEILPEVFQKYAHSKSSEWYFDCPHKECPNPRNKFYFNIQKKIGYCHRCHYTASLTRLIKDIKGVTWQEAQDFCSHSGASVWAELGRILEKGFVTPSTEEETEQVVAPRGFKPITNIRHDVAQYLCSRRGVCFDL